ncbi:MAG: hypothetical protein ACLT4A_00200 [Anaerobutyricum soehngenii]
MEEKLPLLLYDTKDERCPVQELLDSLEPKLLAKKYKADYERGMAMGSYKDYKKRALQNPEVKAEYDALQPEYDIIQAMIDARVWQNMTQKDLFSKTEITQADEQV